MSSGIVRDTRTYEGRTTRENKATRRLVVRCSVCIGVWMAMLQAASIYVLRMH